MNGVLLRGLVLLVLALFTLGACGPDFEPYWKVNKFRVLAIKADPVTLGEGETATLSVAAHDPGRDDITYKWEWCPFRVSTQNRYECPFTVDQINDLAAEQAPEGQRPPRLPANFFDLGDRPTAAFDYPGSREMILGFCQSIVDAIAEAGQDSALGAQLPVIDCNRGFEVSVRLVATTPDDEIIARKRLILATSPQTPINLNPEVNGIGIRLNKRGDLAKVSDTLSWASELEQADQADEPDDDGSEERESLALPADEPLPVVANVPFTLTSIVDPLSVETWRPPAPRGSDRELLPPESEVFLFRWFSSAGGLSDSRGLYVQEKNTLEKASETTFNVPYSSSKSDYDEDGVANGDDNCAPFYNPDQRDSNDDGIGDGCDVYFWSVVRDGRLGIDYVQRRVRVVQW
jgi:hypothetical protein